jgi:hypothetical protein
MNHHTWTKLSEIQIILQGELADEATMRAWVTHVCGKAPLGGLRSETLAARGAAIQDHIIGRQADDDIIWNMNYGSNHFNIRLAATDGGLLQPMLGYGWALPSQQTFK